VQTAGASRVTCVYDEANQITRKQDFSGITTYTHDSDGNRTKRQAPGGSTDYVWDIDSRLTSANQVGSRFTFPYNGDGQRTKRATGSTTKFIYDFKKLLQETDGSDATSALYTQSLEDPYGELVSQYQGGSSSYYNADALGSTAALLAAGESETDTYNYKAFGEINTSTGSTTNPFTYVGRYGYYDDPSLDLYFLNARYYDQDTARFLSEDPVPDSDVNEYRYVFNNPINGIDPSGEDCGGCTGDTPNPFNPYLRDFAYGQGPGRGFCNRPSEGCGSRKQLILCELSPDEAARMLYQGSHSRPRVFKNETNKCWRDELRKPKAMRDAECRMLSDSCNPKPPRQPEPPPAAD